MIPWRSSSSPSSPWDFYKFSSDTKLILVDLNLCLLYWKIPWLILGEFYWEVTSSLYILSSSFLFWSVTLISIARCLEWGIMDNSEKSSYLVFVSVILDTGLLVSEMNDNRSLFFWIFVWWCIIYLWQTWLRPHLELFHLLFMYLLLFLKNLVNIHFYLNEYLWMKWKYNKNYSSVEV